jgi:hypothetical protein
MATATKKATKRTTRAPKATPKQPPKKAEPKVPGVRAMRTRPYPAGQIIKRYGLAAGVAEDATT